MNDTDAPSDQVDQADQVEPTDGLPEENPNRPREYHGARTVIAGAGVVLAVAAALWLTLLGPSGSGEGGVAEFPAWLGADGIEVGSSVGQLAPDFDLETLDGGRFRLSDWRGQPVLVNFWASWCGPCRREVPALIRAQEQHAASGLTVVGVNIEESGSVAQRFTSEFGMEYATPMDYDGAVFRAYGGGGISGPPRSFFIDPNGVIAAIWAGQAPDDVVEAETAKFAAEHGSGREGQLPGLKWPPPVSDAADLTVGAAVGQIAPDMLLDYVEAGADAASRRLSELRGGVVTLAIVPPDCPECARIVSAVQVGEEGALIVLDDAQDTVGALLRLPRDVAKLYASEGRIQFVRVDARGVIVGISNTLEGLD